ncbi:hypothetical protein QVD17_13258 [Tagetes erecta]|uniref:Uncharacterized protein n=1 Tax=Tagetes erecta TaxID=13708 RepID=A0AAD8P213_TARER|nr:hypothetical protein QVD17_13258 [Tagetes erecta]
MFLKRNHRGVIDPIEHLYSSSTSKEACRSARPTACTAIPFVHDFGSHIFEVFNSLLCPHTSIHTYKPNTRFIYTRTSSLIIHSIEPIHLRFDSTLTAQFHSFQIRLKFSF